MTSIVSRLKGESIVPQYRRQSLWTRISAMISVTRQRRALKALDTHLLRDIGVTPAQAAVEAEKPVWNVPAHWTK